MMKNCATCVWLHKICEGECNDCAHGIVNKEDKKEDFGIVSYGFTCKCLVCFDEDSGRFIHWEENKEMTELLREVTHENEEDM